MGFDFGEFIRFENHCFFLKIQGGVCGKVLSCILFKGLIDLGGGYFIRGRRGFIDFSFSFKMLLVFKVKGAVISWVG